ncbi:MAG: ferredoxin [Magnetococcales bacterium]|nr:ferredoxin [Magnetococcales bacterium]
MALSITTACIACWACEPLCVNGAILVAHERFKIDPYACTECEGFDDPPQCVEICPVEGAIITADGRWMSPPGSLAGLDWEVAHVGNHACTN